LKAKAKTAARNSNRNFNISLLEIRTRRGHFTSRVYKEEQNLLKPLTLSLEDVR